jgi:PASTA domain
VVALAIAAAPAVAHADTTTFGSSLTSTPSLHYGCVSPCTTVQRLVPPSVTLPQTSPVNGVITEWAVRESNMGARLALRVLHPTGPVSYTATGTTIGPPTTAASDTIYHYTTSLPIQQGDALGFQAVNGGGSIPVHYYTPGNGWSFLQDLSGPPDGSNGTFTDPGSNSEYELLVQATVSFCKVPDVTGEKSSDAQTALGAAGCSSKVTTKKLKKSKKNKKKKGKVLSQDPAAGTTVAPGTAVDITVGKLKKKK